MGARDLLDFNLKKTLPVILQSQISECGLASLAMVAGYHGNNWDMSALRQRFQIPSTGTSFKHLIKWADELNLSTRVIRLEPENLVKLSTPCILHWDMNHFVVLKNVNLKKIEIIDPGFGVRRFSIKEIGCHFTGLALELTPTGEFSDKCETSKMKVSQLWNKITGLKQSLFTLIVFSLFLQFFVLITPYYTQIVVDNVVMTEDKQLLFSLAAGFGLLALFETTVIILRGWLVVRVSSMLNLQMGLNLLQHMLKLPLSFFEQRHMGDINSRFNSLHNVRERLTSGVVGATIDGLMSILTIIVMGFYSLKLTFVVLAMLMSFIIIRYVLIHPIRVHTEELLSSKAKENSTFMENLRSIQTIKIFGNESQRSALWQNKYTESINAEIRLQRLKLTAEGLNKLLFGLENVIVIYLAAHMIISGTFSLGMLFAFCSYKLILTQRFSALLDQWQEFKMLTLHLDRISDIALAQHEKNRNGKFPVKSISGEIELDNVWFRYSPYEPWILKGISLKISAGDSYAITGPSGCGKSTLLKIMLGLLKPEKGNVKIDGKDINHIGLSNYREKISAVMQDDILFSGNIADNIALFADDLNIEHIVECARKAAVHNEIKNMPMGYDTLVGDMGTTLSGGQKQRIILARAIYKKPSILFLDEATSHLDIYSEDNINTAISSLEITRIIIAHRPDTIRSANNIVILKNGILQDVVRGEKNYFNA